MDTNAEAQETPQLRLMAVHAHPDDEASKGAATLARYAAEGVDVLVVTCTGGERGDILNPRLASDPSIIHNMPEVRKRELAESIKALGVRHAWLGFVDSGLPEGEPLPPLPPGCFALQDVTVAAEPLARLIRTQRPQVLTTYDEMGGYPHPDHIMTHRVSIEAVNMASDPEWDSGQEPWQVMKVYYDATLNLARMLALHEVMIEAGLDSPYEEWVQARRDDPLRSDPEITTRVPCADYFGARDRALLAHATQIDPDGFFFSVPREMEKIAWPTEDYVLAYSTVETSIPEDDLFAGIRGAVLAY